LPNFFQLSVQISGESCTINYPRLLEIKDNHTKNLQAASKSLPSNFPLEEEEEEEEEEDIDNTVLLPEDTEVKKPNKHEIFVNAVVQEYNSICLGLPRVKEITEKRKKAIARLKKEITGLQDLQNWKYLFETVVQSDFLMGKVKEFKCSFDWILDPNNCAKIVEGNYGHRISKEEMVKKEMFDYFDQKLLEIENASQTARR
jgi:hypothetical protein